MKKLLIILFLLLTAYPVSAKNIDLEWTHDGACQSYKIYRGFKSGMWPELVGTVPCPTKQFTDVNIPSGDLYWVVTATDGDIESVASNEEFYAYYYAQTLWEYDTSGKMLYKGENANISSAESDLTWVITKYYYDGSRIIGRKVRITSWTLRAVGW